MLDREAKESSMNRESPARGSILYVIGISMIAALSGFLFGFDMTVVSGTLPFLEYVFRLNGTGLGWAVSSCILACVFGAASAGKLADVLGRKKVLIGTAILFAVSAVGAGWAGTFNWFIVFRLLGGLAIGAASGVAPVYVAETAPTRFRGRFVSFYQLAIVIGLLASYVSNYLLLATGDDAWRWMFAAGVVPAALFFFLLFSGAGDPSVAGEKRSRVAGDESVDADQRRRLRRPRDDRHPGNSACPQGPAGRPLSAPHGADCGDRRTVGHLLADLRGQRGLHLCADHFRPDGGQEPRRRSTEQVARGR